MSSQNNYKIYAIKTYKLANKKFIDTNYIEYNIKTATNLLSTQNNGYHIRIHLTSSYSFFGDLDNYDKTIEDFKKILIDFLIETYNLQIKDEEIFYTQNTSKRGSFHYVIPSLYGSCTKLNEMHKELKKKVSHVDTSVYSEHWFRMPNQSKEGKVNTIHKIITGTMEDHFVEHIQKDSLCVDECDKIVKEDVVKNTTKKSPLKKSMTKIGSEINPEINNNEIKEMDNNEPEINDNFANPDIIQQLLQILNPHRRDNFGKWIKVGLILHNLDETLKTTNHFTFWKNWSMESEKYIDGCCENFWNTMKSIENGLTIKTLYFYAKKDNAIKYQKIIKNIPKLKFDVDQNHIKDCDKDMIHVIKLYALYNKGDIGYTEIYHNEYKNSIICVCKKANTFLMYNEMTTLWEHKYFCDIMDHFLDNMQKLIYPLWSHYLLKSKELWGIDKNKSNEYEKFGLKIKNTPEFYKASKLKSMQPLISSKFFNENILNLINNKSNLLPVKSGIVNLQNGEFRERVIDDYFTFELNVEWKGLNFLTPDIDIFFKNIMLNDTDMIEYLQKLLGYSITGYVNEQIFIILNGNGGNGKSVLQNLLKSLMGKYYRQLSSDVIMETNKPTGGSASPHIMHLFNARLAFTDESDMGCKLNDGIVKSLTGGSAITARQLYGDPITFEPTFQLFLLTNHKPEIVVSQAITRRIILIPFLAEFKSDDKYDKNNKRHIKGNINIESELKEKMDQFLVWLINGSVKYFTNGLGKKPETITTAINEYLDENNDIMNFLNDHCKKTLGKFIHQTELYNAYKKNYNDGVTSKMFVSMMKEKGYDLHKKNNGRMFKNLELK